MATKKTIAEMFDEVTAYIQAHGGNEELEKFINDRKEKSIRKNTNRKPTKEQVANEELANAIYDFVMDNGGGKFKIGDLIKTVPDCAGLSTSKVSSVVYKLVGKGKVIRTEEKGNAYFEFVEVAEEDVEG